TLPALGFRKPLRMWSSVVFPLPDSPKINVCSPFRTVRSSKWKAWPWGYWYCMPSASTTACVASFIANSLSLQVSLFRMEVPMPTCNFINMDDDTDVVHISLTLAKHKTNTRLNNPSYPVNVQLTFSFDYCSEKLIHTMQLGKIQVWMAIVGMLLVTVSHAMGNGGTIEGTVVDAASGSPIDGATVSLLGTAQATVSASDGSFRLAGIQKGAYTLHVSYLGYVEARLGVAVAVGEASTVKVGLEASGEVMDEIVITTARSRGSDLALLAERHQSNLAVEKIGEQELAREGN